MKKRFLGVFALITVFALLFAACGSKETPVTEPALETAPATQAAEAVELGLAGWSLEPSIWSSANGASIDLTATPTAYAEGMTANFVVRLEGEDIVNNPCQWNGTAFTSYADLNAEDGYCYYVTLTGADGSTVTLEINTPTTPFDNSLINLAASLESFCHATVVDTTYEDGKLTITSGTATIQAPQITAGGDPVTCHSAELILYLDDVMCTKTGLNDEIAAASCIDGAYTLDLSGTCFFVQEVEGDHQLTMTLIAYLSDDTTLVDEASTSWFYSDGTMHLTVG